MAVIQVLDQTVAELIAAGEVVERPASIAKELLENSMDAGATSITVEILDGGISMLRVSDNGTGISREDLPRAFLRHATSKIRQAVDLDSILTLGFRGEALASIAAMSRVEMTTRTAEEEGSTCRLEGGTLLEIVPAGCPVGTTITVRDVFYNTPARLKFLKKNASEGSAVAQVIDKMALSHPEVAFRFIRDGQTKLQTSGNGKLLSVISAIYGREFAAQMMPVDYVHENDIGVRGYVTRPSGVRPSRTWQNFFINGRFVKTRTAAAALEEAFRLKIMSGKYPACVLNLEMDAATVDVNVHPAKTEVRFVQEKAVFSAVYFAVKSALAKLELPEVHPLAEQPRPVQADTPAAGARAMQAQPVEHMSAREFRQLFDGSVSTTSTVEKRSFREPLPMAASRPRSGSLDIFVEDDSKSILFGSTTKPSTFEGKSHPSHATINPSEEGMEPLNTAPGTSGKTEEAESPLQTELEKAPSWRLKGELFGTYILLEKPGAMILVDKHAAHERMLYEELKENISYGSRQILLSPQMVVLPREDCSALLEQPELVAQLGFLVEEFGDSTVLVREIPIELGQNDIAFIIAEIADKIKTGNQDLTPEVLDRLYFSIACKSAVRAGDSNRAPELERIVEQLEQNPQITHCPHGRPVMIELTRNEIEKLFGRQV